MAQHLIPPPPPPPTVSTGIQAGRDSPMLSAPESRAFLTAG